MNTSAIESRLQSILARASTNGGHVPRNVKLAPGCDIRCTSHTSKVGRSFVAECILASHAGQVIRRATSGPESEPEIPWDAAAVRVWEDAIIQDVFLGSLHVDVQARYAPTFASIVTLRKLGADDAARKIVNDLTLPPSLAAYAQAFPVIKGALQFYLAA